MVQFSARRVAMSLACASASLAFMSTAIADAAKPIVLPRVSVVPEVDFAKHPPLGTPVDVAGRPAHRRVRAQHENGESKYQLAVLHLPDLKFVSRLDMVAHLSADRHHLGRQQAPGHGHGRGNRQFSEAPRRHRRHHRASISTARTSACCTATRSRSSTAAMANILQDSAGLRPDQRHAGQGQRPFLSDRQSARPNAAAATRRRIARMIFDIDAVNGSVNEIGEIDKDGYDFVVHDGVVRYAYGSDNNLEGHVFYRAGADQTWTELPRQRDRQAFRPARDERRRQEAVFDRQPERWRRTNWRSATSTARERKVLASNPRVSISRRVLDARHRATPFAAIAAEGKPVITYLDDEQVRAGAESAEREVFRSLRHIRRHERGRLDACIISAVSDRDPGTYALFDMKTNNLRPLYQGKPWIKPEQLGERRPFWFKASSGTELGGFVTLPPDRGEKNLPTLLIAARRSDRHQRSLVAHRFLGRTAKRNSSPPAATRWCRSTIAAPAGAARTSRIPASCRWARA